MNKDTKQWRPVRPFGNWPAVNPQPFDTRQSVFIPDQSVSDAQVHQISPRKVQLIGIKVYNASAANSIANATDTTVNFDTTLFNEGFQAVSGTFTTVTIPYQGAYLCTGTIEWSSGDNDRSLWLYVNSAKKDGATQTAGDSTAADKTGVTVAQRQTVTSVRRLAAGDTVGLRVRQNISSGLALSISTGEDNCALSVVFLGTI